MRLVAALVLVGCVDGTAPLEGDGAIEGWAVRFGDEPWGGLRIHDLAVDAAGHRYVVGEHLGRVELGGAQYDAAWAHRTQAYAASFDRDGALRWFRPLPAVASGEAGGQRVVVDAAGRATVLVWAYQPLELDPGHPAPLDEPREPGSRAGCRDRWAFCYLVGLDAAGGVRWAERLEDGASDLGASEDGGTVVVHGDGGALVLAQRTAAGEPSVSLRLQIDPRADLGDLVVASGADRVVLAGRYRGGVEGLPTREGSNAFLMTLDARLEVQEALVLGAGVQVEAVTVDGPDTYLAGRITDEAALGPDAIAGDRYAHTMFLARARGSRVEWARGFASATPLEHLTEPSGLAVDDAGLYVVGTTEGALDFGGPGVAPEPGVVTNFLAAFDKAGAARWAETLGAAPSTAPRVGVDSSGAVHVGVSFEGAFRVGARTLWGRDDVLLARVPPDGDWDQLAALALGGTWRPFFDVGHDVAVDAQGRIYVAASHSRRVAAPDHAAVSFEAALLSLGPDGERRWLVDLGGPDDDLAHAVAVEPATGTSFIVGQFGDRADLGAATATAEGTAAGFLASFDAAGAPRFALAAHSPTWASLDDVVFADALYAVGRFEGHVSVAGQSAFSRAPDGRDVVFARADAAGEVEVVRPLGHAGRSHVPRLAAAPGGGTFLLTSIDDPTEVNSLAAGALVLARLDPQGLVLWSSGFDPRPAPGRASASLRGVALAADDAGHVFIAGNLAGSVDFGGGELRNATTETAAFLASFDDDGAHRWSRVFVGASCVLDGPACGLAARRDGSVYLAAHFWGEVDLGPRRLTTSLLQTDGFVARFDASGAHAWSLGFLGDDPWALNGARAVAVDPTGGVVTAGTFVGGVDFGVETLRATTYDAFVAKHYP